MNCVNWLGVKDERKAIKMFVTSVFEAIRSSVCECVHRKRFLTPLIPPSEIITKGQGKIGPESP